MMTSRNTILAVLLAVGTNCFAQTDSTDVRSRWHYFFSVRSGTLVGCKDCTYQNQITYSAATVHGVMLDDRFGFGIGTGFNSFSEWQTMPLFASTSAHFGRKNKIFLEFNYGYSKAWAGVMPQKEYGFKDSKGGVMCQPSIGYKMAYHDLRVYFLVGYHVQRVESIYEYPNYSWSSFMSIEQPGSSREVAQRFNRLLIQMGIGWR